MAEWLYEEGIGETRAALVENGEIIEARIDWNDRIWRLGAIVDARLGEIDRTHNRAFVILPDGSAAVLQPLPGIGMSEGAPCRVEVVREVIAERSRRKWPKVRLIDNSAPLADGPGIRLQIETSGIPVRDCSPHGPDLLEEAGWSELIEQAATGEIPFAGGSLLMSLTPAMTLFDVDGALPRDLLALAGAAAAAKTVRRFGIGGSIGIDLPSLEGKAARHAAAAAFDAALPPPFERTAVNGFGFVQIVRPRPRRSLPEMLEEDAIGAAARSAVRRAERCGGSGAVSIIASPDIVARLKAEDAWQAALSRRVGRPLHLQAEPGMSRWAVHVQSEHP